MDLPPKKLLQEVTTRWWSILYMLESIVATEDSTTLALRDSKKLHLILTSDEMKRIKEIIELLTCFKKKDRHIWFRNRYNHFIDYPNI